MGVVIDLLTKHSILIQKNKLFVRFAVAGNILLNVSLQILAYMSLYEHI